MRRRDSKDNKLIHDITFQFALAFQTAYNEACDRGNSDVGECLIDAKKATIIEFVDVWNDTDKMEMAISLYLCDGTQEYLEGNHGSARGFASIARFIEQHVLVNLKRTQALINWPKLYESVSSDVHSLVKFFRHRIPCSCLDEKYEEVKSITKVGLCCNPQCSIPGRSVERSKTKYCSRCRCATYCSRQCQIAAWTGHKPHCDNRAAIIAKFHEREGGY